MIGLGGVGSFALRSLSKETKHVLGIERFVRGHSKGSSHGQSRIYRKAYFESPKYVPWIEYSLDQFQILEKEMDVSLMKECGMILVQKDNGHYLEVCRQSAKLHNITTETLRVDALRQRFPHFNYTEDMIGILEPGGGLLRPERTICSALKQAEQQGATIWEGCRVTSLVEVSNGLSGHVELIVKHPSGEDEQVFARSALVGAGSWGSELIPSFRPHLKVLRQIQSWIDVSTLENPEIYKAGNMPGFVLVSPWWPLPLYGLPVDDQCDGEVYRQSIKFGVHERQEVVQPSNNPSSVSREELDEIRIAAKAGLNSEVCSLPITGAAPCLYTMTKDRDFIIGVPKGYQRTFAVLGLSGHGFKMVPALGQMMADFALRRPLDSWQKEFCSPSRFNV